MFQLTNLPTIYLNAVEHRVRWLDPDHEENTTGRWLNTEEKMYTDKGGLLVVRLFLSAFIPGEREPLSIRLDWDLTKEEFEAVEALQGQPVLLENLRISVRGKSATAIFSADAVHPVGDAK